MSKHEKEIANKIALYVSSTYEIIDKEIMKMGKGLFNRKCHLNSVQCLKDEYNNATEVYACITLDAGCISNPVLHFINKTSEGFYVDNTLGWEYALYDYYIIKKLNEDECNHVWDSLQNIRDSLVNLQCGKLYQKIFCIQSYNVL
jgi:hypothetical protein